MIDPDDPNTWEDQDHRIYASNDPDFFVVVDAIDYPFLAKNQWSVHTYSNGDMFRTKLYLRRSVSDFYGPDGERYISEFTGRLTRNRKRIQRNLFLHFVVMIRKTLDEGCYPKDKSFHIVDHHNRDTANCRRSNLRWMNIGGNTRNIRVRA